MYGDNVDARYIGIARQIADAESEDQLPPMSWGSAVLAYTYRALCSACKRKGANANLTGCPLLLQLWSFECFPIGRPWVDAPAYGPEFYRGGGHHLPPDGPTFGSMWTRRRVSYFFLPQLVYNFQISFELRNLLDYNTFLRMCCSLSR